MEQVKECLEKGWTGMGFKAVELEEKWKEYTGHKFAYFLNTNTVGLPLAVNILKDKYGRNEGDEIISTPITFVSTNLAIMYKRLKPVFADVDEYLCLDPDDDQRKITEKPGRSFLLVTVEGLANCRRSLKSANNTTYVLSWMLLICLALGSMASSQEPEMAWMSRFTPIKRLKFGDWRF